jgi:hypothetical protein
MRGLSEIFKNAQSLAKHVGLAYPHRYRCLRHANGESVNELKV